MYTEIRDSNNDLILYKRNSDSLEIPIDINNKQYREVLEWIQEGNIVSPDLNVLNKVKQQKKEELIVEGVRRIGVHVPGWDSIETVMFLVSIWNMLDTASITTQQASARDIYLFVVNTAIPFINSRGTVEQVQSIDVPNHPGWPF